MNEIKIELTEVNPQEFFGSQNRFLEKIRSYYPKLKIVALTATATPKVQDDIVKNLKIHNSKVFKSSFNRPNLFYEVRGKNEST